MSAPSTSSVPPAAAKDIPATKLSPILAVEVDEPLLLAAYTLSLTAEHVLDNNAKNPLLSLLQLHTKPGIGHPGSIEREHWSACSLFVRLRVNEK